MMTVVAPAQPPSNVQPAGMSRETTSKRVPPDASGALPVPEQPLAPAVRLYPSQHRTMPHPPIPGMSSSPSLIRLTKTKRGYLPVYEWQIPGAANPCVFCVPRFGPLKGKARQRDHTIMIDCENGYVQFTGIWKALGHLKADVVKLIDSAPEISEQIKKIRGGYLKIQGTWLPFETARTLARRVAYHLRFELVPIFGPTFPDECLQPGQPGFGQLLLSQPKQRGGSGRRTRVERRAVPHGQSDAYGRPAPASAYHDMPAMVHPSHHQAHGGGPQRRVASVLERYRPYGPWTPSQDFMHNMPNTTSSHLPTPPSSGQQQYRYNDNESDQFNAGSGVMLPIKTGRPAEAIPSGSWGAQHQSMASWHPGYAELHSGIPLMQQNCNGGPPLPLLKARTYTSASDQDAVSSLMSMSGRSPSFVMTPKTAGSFHSLPLSQCPSPKSAPAPAHAAVPPMLPVTTSASAPPFSTRWSPGLLAPPGHYSLKHAHESNMRSGSAEPAKDEEAMASMEEDVDRSRSTPPMISPTTRLPFNQSMAISQCQAVEASHGSVEASA